VGKLSFPRQLYLLTVPILQFKYYHTEKSLWSVDYVRSLYSPIIPYNDDNEDQNVEPGDILNHEYKDEQSLDYSVYDHSTERNPKCSDVDPPMKDMYAFRLIYMFSDVLICNCAAVWEPGMVILTIPKESTRECSR
jgi:hypothetical protein